MNAKAVMEDIFPNMHLLIPFHIVQMTCPINDALKAGKWRECYPDNPAKVTSELLQLIADLGRNWKLPVPSLHIIFQWDRMNYNFGRG
jgi:hypothetical protein